MKRLLACWPCVLACQGSAESLDSDAFDTAASGYAGPWSIAVIEHACTEAAPDQDGATDQWTWSVRTNGWAGDMRLVIVDTTDPSFPTTPEAAWTEVHPLGNVAFDAAATWDAWGVTLNAVGSVDAVRAGSTTLWDCTADDADGGAGGTLAWAAVMYDAATPPNVMDCAMQGHAASTAFSTYEGHPCACLDLDTDCSN